MSSPHKCSRETVLHNSRLLSWLEFDIGVSATNWGKNKAKISEYKVIALFEAQSGA
jgi:hypothetical protein